MQSWGDSCFKKRKEIWTWWLTSVILAIWEAEVGRIFIQGQSREKFIRPHLNQQLGLVTCIFHSSYMGSINRKTIF
jgi:hypothetical protein